MFVHADVELGSNSLLENVEKTLDRKIEFKPKSFDAIFCGEVLEHLTKEEGYELIKKWKNG